MIHPLVVVQTTNPNPNMRGHVNEESNVVGAMRLIQYFQRCTLGNKKSHVRHEIKD